MNWYRVIIRYTVSIVIGVVVGILLLGALGFLLAGNEGLSNGVRLGALFGFMGGIFSMGAIYQAAGMDYSSKIMRRIGNRWHRFEE